MERYDCFIGRWVTFHIGHEIIIKKVYEKNHRPILIMIMDTDEETTAQGRKIFIDHWMQMNKIDGKSMIIPPIASINYGRKVGYDINHIKVPRDIEKISGTELRKQECQD